MLCKSKLFLASAAALAFAACGSAASAAAVCRYVPSLDNKPVHTQAAVDPKAMDAAAGTYLVEDYDLKNVATVTPQGDHLAVHFEGQPVSTFLPESPTRFFNPQNDTYLTFNTNGSGKVSGLVLHRNHMRDLPLYRLDGDKASKLRVKLDGRLDPLTGAPHSKPVLMRLLDEIKAKQLDTKHTVEFEIAFDRRAPETRAFLNDLGPVQSVQFLGFMDSGILGVDGETYDVFHKDGVSRWHIAVDKTGTLVGVETRCGP